MKPLRWCALLAGAVVTCTVMTACGSSNDSGGNSATTSAARTSPSTTPEYPMNQPVQVTAENFVRAESDRYFASTVGDGGFGKLQHIREPMPIERQTVVRANRDTLYSSGVFDLDAGPVTVTLPDAGDRFMSMQVFDEDEYTPEVVYTAGKHTYDKAKIGTRYMMLGIRIFVDPANPQDLDTVHRLQDQIKTEQAGPGKFETPQWDQASQDTVRNALLTLAATLPDTRHSFGPRGHVDQVRHLITAASAWGGNPEQDALYLNVTPPQNNGEVDYRLHVKDVPVDGFWSVSVYNAEGYYQANTQNAYNINNITAVKNSDGSVDIQFGACDGQIPNCLPIEAGWNYMVRLYRPRQNILDGTWTFPEANPIH